MADTRQRVGRQLSFFPLLPRPPQLRSRDVPISDGEQQIVEWLTLNLLPSVERELRYLRRLTGTQLVEPAEITSASSDVLLAQGAGELPTWSPQSGIDHGSLGGLADDDHLQYLPRDGVRDMIGELGTDVGTFRSDVASGGVGFTFNTSNSFTSGSIFRVTNNGTNHFDISHEGHGFIGDGTPAQSSRIFDVVRTLSADSRASFAGINTNITVDGAIPGVLYVPTHRGLVCSYLFNPSSFGAIGNKNFRGGEFSCNVDGSAGGTIAAMEGGRFTVNDIGTTNAITNAYAGRFRITGSFGGGLTNVYGVRQDAITVGTNRWGGFFENRVAIDSPSADAQEVLSLTQSSTGNNPGEHIVFNDKGGNPVSPTTGAMWRNADNFYWQMSTGTREPFRYALMAGS